MIVTRLNAKTQSFEMGGGFGSLSQSDIAAACSGLSELQIALLMFFVCGQERYREHMEEKVEEDLRRIKCGYPDKISKILVQDLYNSACESCNGTGLNRFSKNCGDCKGSGRNTLSLRKLADLLGVSKSRFDRTYKNKYKDCYARFERMAMYSAQRVRDKIG